MRLCISILLWLCVCAVWSCGGGSNKHGHIPVEDFFEKSDKSSFKLSPDGKRIAYIGMDEHCRNIFILDLDNNKASKQLTYQAHMNVQYFFWVNDDSLVYSNTQSYEDSLRIYTIDVHTDQSELLMPVIKGDLKWITPLRANKNYLYAQMNVQDSNRFDLYKIPLDGSGAVLFEKNSHNFNSWYLSDDGQIRMALSSDSVQESLWYREEENLEYTKITQTDYSSVMIPMGPVKNVKHEMHALSNLNSDKLRLVRMDLTTGRELEVLYADKENDLNKEGYSFNTKSMLYSSVYDAKKKTVVHNHTLAKMYKKVQQHFEGYTIDILDVDRNLNALIFKTYTDVNPGSIYYYYTKTDKIVELSPQNPSLVGKQLSQMKEISFNARDGKLIHGFLTYPSTEQTSYPVVVLVHDGPSRRDVWGFNTEVQFLANRGYLVFQINYRGSVGFGKKFYTSGFKQWGGEIQNDLNDGVTWLINEGIADPERVAIMGSGFGGYSALYAACFHPTLYKCAISSSGYTNMFTYFKEIPPHYQSYIRLYHQIIGDPQRESDLFKAISPLFHADKVRTPMLIFQGGKDRFTSSTDINQFVQRLKSNNVPVRYVYYKDEGKRFKKEENVISSYQEVEQFLATYLK